MVVLEMPLKIINLNYIRMKKLFIISLFLFSLSNYAQELKYENGKFYQVGRPISNKNVKALLESNPKAIELYKFQY